MTARTITAHSADGTPVRFTSYGSGPPIVLIHGAFSTSADYRLVGDMLASNHEVLLLERRGSGSPATDLTGARFAQDGRDIVAVLDRLDMPALLFGHSAGAVAALEATRAAGTAVRGLALYEAAGPAPAALLDRFRALSAAGDPATAVAAFVAAGGGPSEQQLATALRQPAWAERLLLVDGVQRDLAAQVAYVGEQDWSDIDSPVAIFLGERTSGTSRRRAETLAQSLLNAQLVTLPGQGHLANMMAPELLADAIHHFDLTTTTTYR